MGKQLEDIERVRGEAARFGRQPYLVTVAANGQPHCSVVAVDWSGDGGRLLTRAPRGWAEASARGQRQVTLLWPPDKPDGYSLIVDGTAEDLDGSDGPRIAVTPSRAVLHRPGDNELEASGCGSDCVPLLPG